MITSAFGNNKRIQLKMKLAPLFKRRQFALINHVLRQGFLFTVNYDWDSSCTVAHSLSFSKIFAGIMPNPAIAPIIAAIITNIIGTV